METLEIKPINQYVYLISLNRPSSRNAINSVMMRELFEVWNHWVPTIADLRCLILTGHGDQAFCAGADLKERLHLEMTTWKNQRIFLEKSMLAMANCSIPVIAAVNGSAYGGGLELALACDFIYAANTATFAQSEVKLGLMPGAMGTQNLPKAAGLQRAKELAFTGEVFTAQQGYDWGIVNKVLPSADLLTSCLETANSIAENAPKAIRKIKEVLTASSHLDLNSGYHYEISAYNELLSSKDREEGIRAFNEKRKPIFKNE